MALNNRIEDAEPDIVAIYTEAKARWKKDYPLGPWPELNETYRSPELQAAYYAQGRRPLSEVNKLRAALGLYLLSASENRRVVTNAKPGQSNHNIYPSPALDVRFRLYAPKKPGGKLEPAGITWAEKYYLQFGGYMIAAAGWLKAAGKITRKMRWGYDWNGNGKNDQSFYDMPHYETV
jgi:hypothetical protein